MPTATLGFSTGSPIEIGIHYLYSSSCRDVIRQIPIAEDLCMSQSVILNRDYKKSKTKTIMFWKVVLYSDSRSQHIIRQDIYIYNVDNSDFTRVRMACTSL